jgi:hypothetical protein
MPSSRQGKWQRASRPLNPGGSERTESWRGIDYRVRQVSGAGGSGGPYRCPGCDQLLAAGVAHMVAWRADDPSAVDRRHWHSGCWAARESRQPGVQRSRNAPRYG